MEKKGTVTSLSSLFPPEEAQKASQRVVDTIADRQKLVDQLQNYISDNKNLINIVHQLPDKLHHDIMVPFGKAAFFPGRMVHTNEFLVLLGADYYVDRTSKQAIDILKRREANLESQVESLKAVIQDLKAEASFFDVTASEAAEGIVEIREDYIDSASPEKVLPADNKRATVEDDEYARLLSRMEELEKEELEAENSSEDEVDEVDLSHHTHRLNGHQEVENLEMDLHDSVMEANNVYSNTKSEDRIAKEFHNQLTIKDSKVQPASKDEYPLEANIVSSKLSISGNEPNVNLPEQPRPKSEGSSVQSHETHTNSSRKQAFTGSIVEHTHNIYSNSTNQPAASSSKPVSRFKMQRRQQ